MGLQLLKIKYKKEIINANSVVVAKYLLVGGSSDFEFMHANVIPISLFKDKHPERE